jgi:two-component system sensor histidine kinase UhpB
VRANEITLMASDGQVLYRSPSSPYKAGRSAPAWFAALVEPPPQSHEIRVTGGTLRVQADASRAVLDGWDELCQLALSASLILAVVSAAVFWAVGRAVQPLGRIVQALTALEQGHFQARLPQLPGAEAGMIGAAVNRLAEAIDTQLQTRMQAFEAQRQLAESQEWAHRVEQRLEAERKEIAAELHDEFGQSVTAIRTLARSVVLRLPEGDGSREALSLIDQEACRLYDAMHGLIPRLTPLTLGPLGLRDALADLVASFRTRYRQWTFHVQLAPLPSDGSLSAEVALAAYRVVQEAVTNAIKYSGGSNLEIVLSCDADRQPLTLGVSVDDDGCGMPPPEQRPTRFGLLGLRERVTALGGTFEAARRADRGTHVGAQLPLASVVKGAA